MARVRYHRSPFPRHKRVLILRLFIPVIWDDDILLPLLKASAD
jgi:hypothetical protein